MAVIGGIVETGFWQALALDNGSNLVAVVVSGSGHTIDEKVAIALNSDAWITTSGSGDSLYIAGDIGNGAAAHGVVKDGPGTLILSGSDTYTGGTLVRDGTLIVASSAALADGTSLTIGAGGTSTFDPSAVSLPAESSLPVAPAAAAAAPEPGTFVLLAAGALIATIAAWRRTSRRGRGRSMRLGGPGRLPVPG